MYRSKSYCFFLDNVFIMFFFSFFMVSLRELITQRKTELSSVESQLQQQQESISGEERRLGQEERVFLEQTTPLQLIIVL